MPQLWAKSSDGVNCKLREMWAKDPNNVNRKLRELWAKDNSGVNRKIFSGYKAQVHNEQVVSYNWQEEVAKSWPVSMGSDGSFYVLNYNPPYLNGNCTYPVIQSEQGRVKLFTLYFDHYMTFSQGQEIFHINNFYSQYGDLRYIGIGYATPVELKAGTQTLSFIYGDGGSESINQLTIYYIEGNNSVDDIFNISWPAASFYVNGEVLDSLEII